MADSKIEWTEKVWNPVTGCSKVSEGCRNCYAERMSKRLAGRAGYPKDDPFQVTIHEDRLRQPLTWKKPSDIFVCSMGDLFHEMLHSDVIQAVFENMNFAMWHRFFVLTKRPERMNQLIARFLDHVIPGVSIEDQPIADKRVTELLKLNAANRFVSYEPALGPLDLTRISRPIPGIHSDDPSPGVIVGNALGDWDRRSPFSAHQKGGKGISWVIAGCESGPKRRPADIDWFRSLRDQCVEAGVSFFLKQMEISGKVVKMPELDGQVWDQRPEAQC